MNEKAYTLYPRDLLFMRDARPMEASDAGLGANWPRPDQLWNALINAFHRQWPVRQPWEGTEHTKRSDENQLSSCRFGALKTFGPLPVSRKDGKVVSWLPCPLDVSLDEKTNQIVPMRLEDGAGTDLPKPLKWAFASAKIGKAVPPAWITREQYDRYLLGESFKGEKIEIYDVERNIGIEIDPKSHSTVEGKFYQAEYLRLREGVGLAFQASCDIKPKGGGQGVDVFDKLDVPLDLIFGGQQGIVRMKKAEPSILPLETSKGTRLRWTLLSPAIFPSISTDPGKGVKAHSGGWLPNWIDSESGQVMLPQAKIEKTAGESRDAWRQRIKDAPKFGAKLVAARIGKPMAFSGWDLQTGPKPTMIAVPAGSVYVFDCDSKEEAGDLARMLSWPNRRSTLFGEKGFGVGVCSFINKE